MKGSPRRSWRRFPPREKTSTGCGRKTWRPWTSFTCGAGRRPLSWRGKRRLDRPLASSTWAAESASKIVSDRIETSIEGTPKVLEALKSHQDYIGEETLTTAFREQTSPEFTVEKEVEGEALTIKLTRVSSGG